MFRFTIRDVLWLTVVVALAVAWGVDRWRLRESVEDLDSRLYEYERREGLRSTFFEPDGWRPPIRAESRRNN